jgi:anaerobic selenocysteine-containing dehydrogenase
MVSPESSSAHPSDRHADHHADHRADQHPDRSTHYRICPLCEACCGLNISTEPAPARADGQPAGRRVVGIRGADQDFFSKGYLCPKAFALKDLHEDPDRLRTPLVRRNGQLVPATWTEAFAEIERRLPPLIAQHGSDAVALAFGNPVVHKFGLVLYLPRLVKALRSKNIFTASTLDQMPKQLASGLMFGHWLSVAVPDIERTQWLLVLGANPAVSNGSMWTVPDFRGKAKALRARGGRLTVVDPRRTETAALADEHHFIRPAGDVFLLAAMAHTLFAEGLVRLGRLEPHVNGLAALQAALQSVTPERVAGRCGIAAPTIRRLAREFAQAPSAAIYSRLGTCGSAFGTLASWLVDALHVLAGRLDSMGGALFPKAPALAGNSMGPAGSGRGVSTGRHKSRVSGAPEVWGEFPMTLMAEEMQTPGPGQVKALITVATNPVLSSPGGPAIAKALDGLDFMVSLDLYLNETTRHAHVVLPGQSPLEHSHYDIGFSQLSHHNQARYSQAVLEPEAGTMSEWEVMAKLAAIVAGQGANADVHALDHEALDKEVRKLAGEHADTVLQALGPQAGPERWLDLALRTGPYGDRFGLKPSGLNLDKMRAAAQPTGGVDLGALAPRIPEVLRTPSGRVELAPPSLLADLPRALTDLDTAPAPLVLIGRRDVRSNNSWMHNLHTLAKGPERSTALVNAADAASAGVADGAQATLRSAVGAVRVTVELSTSVPPGVISLPHGWGHNLPGTRLQVASERPGSNLNALLTPARDPLSGNAVLSGEPVTLAP